MLGTGYILVDSIVVIGGSILCSLLVLWLVRSLVSHEQLVPHNEVSGFVYAAVGVIYAVILGFAVVSVWEQYLDAETNAREEANDLADLYRIAEGLPEPERSAIQVAAVNYASDVVDLEWGSINRDGAPSFEAAAHLDELWASMYGLDLSSPADEALFAAGLDQLDDLSSHRRERIEDAGAGLLSIMWGVMIGGAVLIVLFPCLFGVENRLVHSLIVSALAATLGLLLLLTYDLNHPLQGSVHVQPLGFTQFLERVSHPGDNQDPDRQNTWPVHLEYE